MGKDEEFIIKQSKLFNKPIPNSILNAPLLRIDLELFYEAFNMLNTSRNLFEGGIGYIPYNVISCFCKDENIIGETREDVFYYIQMMDNAYVQYQSKKLINESR